MPARVPVTLTFDFFVDDIKWQLWLAFVLRLNLPADTPDLPQAGQEIARFFTLFSCRVRIPAKPISDFNLMATDHSPPSPSLSRSERRMSPADHFFPNRRRIRIRH